MQKVLQEIIKQALDQKVTSDKVLRKIKSKVVKKHGVKAMPSDVQLLKEYRKMTKDPDQDFLELLKTRKIRTLSGVAIVAVLTKAYPCPGNCLYCPDEKEMPKSYLSNEPAVMRAILCKFDPYKQVKLRLRALSDNGHNTDKCELIVMGGTWSYLPKKYQSWFIKRCYDAFNNFKARNIDEAKKKNETAKHRVIGMTLETRPDYIDQEEVERMRKFGATRVELGVQTVYDSILKYNRRGHLTDKTIKATKLLREAGFKITYHLMPNLPGSDLQKDLSMFKKIFSDARFQPDQIKIYPCVVTKDSELYDLWKNKKYKSYTDAQLKDLLIKVKKIIPPWVRIARLIRDIPSESIISGNKITNLRQILQQEEAKCNCIRCREPHRDLKNVQNAKLIIRKYGEEIFLSYEDPPSPGGPEGIPKNPSGFHRNSGYLYAFCRLHLGKKAIIRELHTYGQMMPIVKGRKAVQHLGFGKKLLAEAEKITQQKKYKELWVISGVGARAYYRKLDYRLKQEYMVKKVEYAD